MPRDAMRKSLRSLGEMPMTHGDVRRHATSRVATSHAVAVVRRAVRRHLALLAVLGSACSTKDEPAAPPPSLPVATAVASEATSFGLYVLALSWAPSFCCGHANKEECANLATSFAGSHLTLHGLWPNFTDAEQRGGVTYPQFCGAYQHCKKSHDGSCEPDPATIPAEMATLGPGYVGDHDFLAAHEWPKHGSCTGLDPAAYFRAALASMKALPGEGTPKELGAAIGGELPLDALASSFGIPATSVLLSCDAQCRLSQVSFCLAHDAHDVPTTPVACPRNTTAAQYDNGCVTRGCTTVTVPAANSCERTTGTRPPRPQRHEPGAACNHPGQGPACSDNDSCKTAGYLRCARSGCCTSQH